MLWSCTLYQIPIKTQAMKISALLLVLFTTSLFLLIRQDGHSQFRNWERILGKKNPYVSVVKGDSVTIYQQTDSTRQLLEKTSVQNKILLDLRVVNRNINTLEIWIGVSIFFNFLCMLVILKIFLLLKRKRE